jgi:L-threonylcarbamoyladenylate synthase
MAGSVAHAGAFANLSVIRRRAHDVCCRFPVRRGTDIDHAVSVLRAGGLVAFPTETVYGLGADASSGAAARRVFAAKGRPVDHPLIVHLRDAPGELDRWCESVPAAARLLAEKFWPGPLTLIVQRGARIAPEVTGGGDTVGLRTPAHPLAQRLLAAFGGAIAAPSANRYGQISPTTADHVLADLGDDVDYVLDGGECEVGVESTIVDLTGPVPVLRRPGGAPRAELEGALGVRLAEPAAPKYSGSQPSHYAPGARVIAVAPDQLAAAVRAEDGLVAVLAPASVLAAAGLPASVRTLALPDDLDDAARRLYAALRELDATGVDVIVAALPPEVGLGEAIADRLRRAAGPRKP